MFDLFLLLFRGLRLWSFVLPAPVVGTDDGDIDDHADHKKYKEKGDENGEMIHYFSSSLSAALE